jgi:hypothetical protein
VSNGWSSAMTIQLEIKRVRFSTGADERQGWIDVRLSRVLGPRARAIRLRSEQGRGPTSEWTGLR